MKLIPLTRGLFAQVDDEDFDFLNQWKWFARESEKTYYAVRNIKVSKGTQRQSVIFMHRIVLRLNDPKNIGDHIDHNGLNNQRNNLRECTRQQNTINRINRGKVSKYKGVSISKRVVKDKLYKYWYATISKGGKSVSLGTFPFTDEGEILAAKTYDVNALELYGDFAYLNFK